MYSPLPRHLLQESPINSLHNGVVLRSVYNYNQKILNLSEEHKIIGHLFFLAILCSACQNQRNYLLSFCFKTPKYQVGTLTLYNLIYYI